MTEIRMTMPNGPVTNWLTRLIERALGATEIYWTRALLLLALAGVVYLGVGAPGSPLARHAAQLEAAQGSITTLATSAKADVGFQFVQCLRVARTAAERADCRAIREGREPSLVGEAAGGPR